MALRAIFLGATLLVSSLLPAAADSVTATVKSWEPQTRTLVLSDNSQFQTISQNVQVPDTLAAGQTITVTFEGTEDGVKDILSIEIQP